MLEDFKLGLVISYFKLVSLCKIGSYCSFCGELPFVDFERLLGGSL